MIHNKTFYVCSQITVGQFLHHCRFASAYMFDLNWDAW